MKRWSSVKFGDICGLTRGRLPVLQATNGPERKPYLVVKYLRGERSAQFASIADRNSVDVSADDVIIICDGSNSGETFLGVNGVLASTMAKISHPKSIDARYLRLYLASLFDKFNTAKTGAAIPHLDLTSLRNETLPFPPKVEQQRIAGTLEQAFKKIETLEAQAKCNAKAARDLFEGELNGVFSKNATIWRTAQLGEHVTFIDYRGRTPKKTTSGTRLITAKNVRMGYVKETPAEFISDAEYDSWMSRGKPVVGDVLFTTEAPLANVAQLTTQERVVFAQRIIVMHPDPKVLHNTFLKYALMAPSTQRLIHDQGTGATATGIKARLLKKIDISFPRSVTEQEHVAKRLAKLSDRCDRLIENVTKRLDLLYELRQSLFTAAFDGDL